MWNTAGDYSAIPRSGANRRKEVDIASLGNWRGRKADLAKCAASTARQSLPQLPWRVGQIHAACTRRAAAKRARAWARLNGPRVRSDGELQGGSWTDGVLSMKRMTASGSGACDAGGSSGRRGREIARSRTGNKGQEGKKSQSRSGQAAPWLACDCVDTKLTQKPQDEFG